MESKNLDQLAMDAINENFELAEYAIKTPRKEGTDSCYGNSALLLLSSVLDAIGSYYIEIKKGDKASFVSFENEPNFEKRKGGGVHFENVYDIFISNRKDNCGYTSRDMFKKDFYENFRCGVTHNAVFSEGKITLHNNTDSSSKTLNIKDLLDMVRRIKDEFFNTHKNVFTFSDNTDGPITGLTQTNKVIQNKKK